MGKKVHERIISEDEYLARLEQGVPVGNCWVDMGNGQLAYALQEVVVVGVPFNKYGDKFFDVHAINVCVADNTRIDTQRRDAQISNVEKQIAFEQRKKEVNNRLYQVTKEYFRLKKAQSFPDQQLFNSIQSRETLLLCAIANEKQPLIASAFPSELYAKEMQLINEFIRIRSVTTKESNSENVKEAEVGFWEGLIPVWGSARNADINFNKGNYWYGIGYTLLAISDIFIVRSIATGIGKGAWKLGSHSWSATRRWILKHNWAQKEKPVHHWLIQQQTAKKYGIEAFTNQPWNWVKFENQSLHMRFGHGVQYQGVLPGSTLQQFWYGTPHWFKIGTTNIGGHIIMENIDDE